VDTKDSVMDELVKALICLRKAHVWWVEDAQYLTRGDYGSHNVFDDVPDWVGEAYALLNTLEEPTHAPPMIGGDDDDLR